MQFFELHGEMSFWISALLGTAFVLFLALVFVSGRTPGTQAEEGEGGEQRSHSGFPVVIAVVVLVFAAWAIGYTAWVMLSGKAI